MFQFFSTLLFLVSIRVVRSAVEPAPIVVESTGKFSGNDGSWSSFKFGVGTPSRVLELLPSTQIPESWIVLDVGCTENDPKNCSESRGGTFNYEDSSTWTNKSFYALGSEANLGYTTNSDNGFYAWDNVTLITPEGANISVNHSVVAGIATKDFYLGALGLAARPVVWEDHSDSSPSLMTTLKDQSLIPTLSYGYTAGASYKSAPGSLTLGGYDTSRLTPNDVTFAFGPQTARQLLVSIQAISVTNSKGPSQLLTQGMFALVDSTVPHIWLPAPACDAFEAAFGIEFDPITNLYLVNDDQHDAMIKQEAEVTFQLGTSINGGDIINIKLPYASFDLEARPPLVKSQRRYFPLRRAKDETQYTLGRTFLQEAFIIVDYDNNKFSISQAQYTQGQPSHIVVTSAEGSTNATATDSTPETPPLTKTSSHKSGGIGTGAIAGIAAAIIILALLAAAYCLWRFRLKKSWEAKKKIKGKAELEDNSEPKGVHEAYGKRRLSEASSQGDTTKGAKVGVNEVPQTPPVELEGGPSNSSMSMEHLGRAELPSPDPFSRPHELESPGLGIIRSELSTPEPPSELSTSDRNLVPELTSREMFHELTSQELPHELSSSNRNSSTRPLSYRNHSLDGDNISPQDSASIRPGLHERKGSDDTIPTPASPIPQRPPLRSSQRRHNSRPSNIRLNSLTSHDTFQTRFNELTPPGGNTPSLPPPQPLEPPGARRTNSYGHAQGLPSPLASPPLGGQPSPSLSALNSPTFQLSHQRIADNGPPTPNFDISTASAETTPLMNQSPQQGSRSTRFAEDFTTDPEAITREAREQERRDETERRVVRTEVEKLEDRLRIEGK
ncbi:MAG: hypothetical protein Q9166_000236 [cf. Caloplaca sp. 2 TL-2023]